MTFISVSEFLLSSASLAYVCRNVNYSAPVLIEVAVYNPDNSKTEVKIKIKMYMFLFSLHSYFCIALQIPYILVTFISKHCMHSMYFASVSTEMMSS